MKLLIAFIPLLFLTSCNSCGVLFEDETACQQRNKTLEEQITNEYTQILNLAEQADITLTHDIYQEEIQWYKKTYGNNWRQKGLESMRRTSKILVDRVNLINGFRATHPDNWQQKLFEYDLEQKRGLQQLQRDYALAILKRTEHNQSTKFQEELLELKKQELRQRQRHFEENQQREQYRFYETQPFLYPR